MIPNYIGAGTPASSDPLWIETLTLDLEIQLYDCSIDFDISGLSMLDASGIYTYQIGTGNGSEPSLTPWLH